MDLLVSVVKGANVLLPFTQENSYDFHYLYDDLQSFDYEHLS